uniref:Sugar phosphate transporter domain-containing protein n=1 Tax=Setaria italica TaxID=4555 RepID=K3Y2Z5_SETIT
PAPGHGAPARDPAACREMGLAEAGEPSSILSLAAAVSYGVASMAMVFVNKAVLMQYVHSMTLLTLQVLLNIMA